jgi:uncharacterized ion transporter superfamily protein YfcC
MTDALLMDMVYVGCGIVAGLIIRKLVVTYCKRPWVGLTENEIKHLWYEACQTNLELTSQLIVHLARNIEAKLKEKNT